MRTTSWMVSGLLLVTGCATLQQVAALRQVQFHIDGVSNASLAGIDLGRVRSYQDLGVADIGRLALAVSSKNVPFVFNLHVSGENPRENTVTARLIRLDWTLLLEDRETVSGSLDQEVTFPPGTPQDIPIAMRLNLYTFFESNARDMFDLALALTGQGGAPKQVSLRATPTIETPIGPMRYPQPITIVSRTVGSR